MTDDYRELMDNGLAVEEQIYTVLMVEDDPELGEALAEKLLRGRMSARLAPSASSARRLLRDQEFDVALLDVGLPDGSGFDLCREIRAESDMPILFLTAADAHPDRYEGFELGADDYLIKPLSLHEVILRVRAVLRRTGRRTRVHLKGPLGISVDRVSREARVGGELLALTSTEFDLLCVLLEQRQRVLSADDISAALWGHGTFDSPNYVEQHVSRLRSKLRTTGAESAIETVRGVGYSIS